MPSNKRQPWTCLRRHVNGMNLKHIFRCAMHFNHDKRWNRSISNMIPVSDGMSETTRAIYRRNKHARFESTGLDGRCLAWKLVVFAHPFAFRSPLHLSRGSWFDLPETESVTSWNSGKFDWKTKQHVLFPTWNLECL